MNFLSFSLKVTFSSTFERYFEHRILGYQLFFSSNLKLSSHCHLAPSLRNQPSCCYLKLMNFSLFWVLLRFFSWFLASHQYVATCSLNCVSAAWVLKSLLNLDWKRLNRAVPWLLPTLEVQLHICSNSAMCPIPLMLFTLSFFFLISGLQFRYFLLTYTPVYWFLLLLYLKSLIELLISHILSFSSKISFRFFKRLQLSGEILYF